MKIVVRPVIEADIDQIYNLSSFSQVGLTTLPHDYPLLQKRIKDSVKSFTFPPDKPGFEIFLFVMEDLDKKKIVGTCSLVSKVGGFEPFYTYRIKTIHTESKLLNVRKEIQYLQLVMDHNGPSEIGTLFLSPEYRRFGQGRLLSLSRFLFLAQYPEYFEDKIIAEMRGVIDEQDHSPFWEALGKYFFEVDFKKADLMVMTDKSFIADLIPQYPIYIPLLPKEVQKVIGQVHKETEPALHLLKEEGFHFKKEIDIFEAGPVLEAKIKRIRTVRESKLTQVQEIISGAVNSPLYLIASVENITSFRAAKGNLKINEDGTLRVPEEVAQALNLNMGGEVRYVPLRSEYKNQ